MVWCQWQLERAEASYSFSGFIFIFILAATLLSVHSFNSWFSSSLRYATQSSLSLQVVLCLFCVLYKVCSCLIAPYHHHHHTSAKAEKMEAGVKQEESNSFIAAESSNVGHSPWRRWCLLLRLLGQRDHSPLGQSSLLLPSPGGNHILDFY